MVPRVWLRFGSKSTTLNLDIGISTASHVKVSYLRILEQTSGHDLGFLCHFVTSDWFLVADSLILQQCMFYFLWSSVLLVLFVLQVAKVASRFSLEIPLDPPKTFACTADGTNEYSFEHSNQYFCKNARKVCSGPLSLNKLPPLAEEESQTWTICHWLCATLSAQSCNVGLEQCSDKAYCPTSSFVVEILDHSLLTATEKRNSGHMPARLISRTHLSMMAFLNVLTRRRIQVAWDMAGKWLTTHNAQVWFW